MTTPPPPSATAAEASASYKQHGLFWMRDILRPDEVDALREAAQQRFGEVLRTLLVRHIVASASDDETPPVRYAEVVERDGGRYDSRHGFGEPPFTSLLREGGLGARLVPALRSVLGDQAEVVAVGQIVAMSPGGWELLDDEAGDQGWHTDGRYGNLETDALTVFLPLRDFTASNGPTEFLLGSHVEPRAAECAALSDDERGAAASTLHLRAGEAVAFDYRLWHRGLANTELTDRPVLYAIIGRPVFTADGLKGVPVLDRGGSESLLRPGTEVAPAATFRVGAQIVASGHDTEAAEPPPASTSVSTPAPALSAAPGQVLRKRARG